VHAAGMGSNEKTEPHVFEHFGISPIEALSFGCIPICVRGGFPKHYIEHGKNGYLFQDELSLYTVIVSAIREGNLDTDVVREMNFDLIKKFSSKAHTEKIVDMIISNTGKQ
tara:strand:+ start:254 stop:586 length:333 start_codon:yes stop_codon:yes gene_type:complete